MGDRGDGLVILVVDVVAAAAVVAVGIVVAVVDDDVAVVVAGTGISVVVVVVAVVVDAADVAVAAGVVNETVGWLWVAPSVGRGCHQTDCLPQWCRRDHWVGAESGRVTQDCSENINNHDILSKLSIACKTIHVLFKFVRIWHLILILRYSTNSLPGSAYQA